MALAVVSGVPRSANAAGRRAALVIGNSDYTTKPLERLPDVPEAAVHMADTLAALGFDVYEHRALLNQTKQDTLSTLNDFAQKTKDADLVVVYFTGHGGEQDRRNRLMPIDARPDSSGSLRPAIDFDTEFLAAFKGSTASLVFIIDACREVTGLGAMAKPTDQDVKNRLIAFPVRHGNYVTPPSRYTPALIESLQVPGLSLEDVFDRTRRVVQERSQGQETPEEIGSLIRDTPIYFHPTVIPEGTLATVDRNTYYLVTDGMWRRIPDIESIDRLGFDLDFAHKEDEEARVRAPHGEQLELPSVDGNVLESRACLYFLFWGMKWCVPQPEREAALMRYEKGPRRPLTAAESRAIPTGDIGRLPNGLILRFGDASDLYETNSGVLASVAAHPAGGTRPIVLPPFMQRALQVRRYVNTNQLVNAHLILDEARQLLYVIDEQASEVILADMKTGRARSLTGLSPSFMAYAPTKGHLFVADSTRHVIHQISVDTAQELTTLPQVSRTATPFTGMAITPDETRLYVGNEGGGGLLSAGGIVVYDLQHPSSPVGIGGVACPEGMGITADGEHIYLASQCGGGKDALFVVDTNLDIATSAVADLAVGRSAVVVPTGRKAYVSRGEPERITIIDAMTGGTLGSLAIAARAMSVSQDGSTVVVSDAVNRKTLHLIDTATDRVTTVQLGWTVEAVTMGESNGNAMVVAWVPERKEAPIYFQSVAGLLPGPN